MCVCTLEHRLKDADMVSIAVSVKHYCGRGEKRVPDGRTDTLVVWNQETNDIVFILQVRIMNKYLELRAQT